MERWYSLVGTSHIASQAVRAVRQAFEQENPDVVAVELDPERLVGLLATERPKVSIRLVREVGIRGYLFALIGGSLQRRLGRIVDVLPGSDMLAAVRLAQHHAKKALLIDRDLRVTLQRLNHALGWRELKQFCWDLWRSFRGKERFSFDLSKIPDERTVERILQEFRQRYPRLYRVLVAERNRHMAEALLVYHRQHPAEKLLVVVGAGHVTGLRQLLEASQELSQP
jgi:pheromone shutdown protein TraB